MKKAEERKREEGKERESDDRREVEKEINKDIELETRTRSARDLIIMERPIRPIRRKMANHDHCLQIPQQRTTATTRSSNVTYMQKFLETGDSHPPVVLLVQLALAAWARV